MFALGIIKLFRNTMNYHTDPELYYRCFIETIFFAIMISGIITYLFNPDYYETNLSMKNFGYNNACVTFDSFPAKYFAAPVFSLATYFGIRFVVSDSLRLYRMENNQHKMLTILTYFFNFIFGITILFLSSLLTITPEMNGILHSSVFLVMILFSTLCAILRYIVCYAFDQSSVRCHNIIFGIVYLILTISYIASLTSVVVFHQNIPYIILRTLDYSWFCCLFLSSYLFVDMVDSEFKPPNLNASRSV